MARELDINYRTAWAVSKKMMLFGGCSVIRTRERMWPFLDMESERPDKGRDLIAKVNAVIPKSFPEQVRADLAQDMILGVLAGDMTEADLAKSIPKYWTKYYKGYDNRFACLSWDQPVPGTDGQRWDDKISSDYAAERFDYVNSR